MKIEESEIRCPEHPRQLLDRVTETRTGFVPAGGDMRALQPRREWTCADCESGTVWESADGTLRKKAAT
jgi:hypothetical protein